MSTQICLALGSNLGDRENNLEQAVSLLQNDINISTVSDWVETEPVDCPPQSQKFLNGAILGQTELSAMELLKTCLNLEKKIGRIRDGNIMKNAPRAIDIDLIFYGQEIFNNVPDLIVPHPRMHLREFVLQPLAQIAPEFIHPEFNKSIAELLTNLRNENETNKN